MRPCDLEKIREIVFHDLPAGQVERALILLEGLDGLVVTAGPDGSRLLVRYHICEYTLEGLEAALVSQGFHLDNSLLNKLLRALHYYSEEAQCANLGVHSGLRHHTLDIFIHRYQLLPHGCRDNRPDHWRRYL
mgnify:CR=1 FL=1